MRRGPTLRAGSGVALEPAESPSVSPLDTVVATWSAAGRALRQARRGAQILPEEADLRVFNAMARATVVSFDVFDTLVTRTCATPSDVFLFLALEPPFQALGLSPAEVRAHRQAAEQEVRQARFAASRTEAEVNLSEIHMALARRLGLAEGTALAAAELAAERRLLRANPRVCAWLNEARRAAKRILAISDTWYSAAEIHGLLQHVGIDIPTGDIVTSADHRASKQEGSLFGITQRIVGIDAATWLHIGDHPTSDEQTPRRLGIATILHPFDGARDTPSAAPNLSHSLRRGLVVSARHRPEQTAWRIGYQSLGPLMLSFAQWIGQQAREQGAKRVVFLLRDGLLFERICRTAGVLPDGVQSVIMPSSRRAALVPALLSDTDWSLTQLLAGVGQRPIGEYLDRLGVPSHSFKASLAQAGVPDLGKLVDARLPADHALVRRLFTAPDVLNALAAVATRERDTLLLALKRAGLRDSSPSLLVDLGWNGTIQKALHRVVKAADRRDPAWHGCYLATWPGVSSGAPETMRSAGFLCSAGAPTHVPPVLAVGRELLEVLCSSLEGSLMHFSGKEARPVLAPYEFDEAHAAAVHDAHDGAAAYAADHAAVLGGEHGAISAGAALEEWARLTRAPTDEEARFLGALSHSDNIGSHTSRRLARFTAAADDFEGLLRDHSMAYWKEGLLAQRSAQGAALAGMLWFAGNDSIG